MFNNCFSETISIEEYTSIWKQIREVLLRLGGPPIRVRLHRIENEVLDAEMQTHYINKVNENWSSNHKRIVFTPKSSSSRNTKGKTKRKNKAEQEGKTKFYESYMYIFFNREIFMILYVNCNFRINLFLLKFLSKQLT